MLTAPEVAYRLIIEPLLLNADYLPPYVAGHYAGMLCASGSKTGAPHDVKTGGTAAVLNRR
jgi:hypothetical protein